MGSFFCAALGSWAAAFACGGFVTDGAFPKWDDHGTDLGTLAYGLYQGQAQGL